MRIRTSMSTVQGSHALGMQKMFVMATFLIIVIKCLTRATGGGIGSLSSQFEGTHHGLEAMAAELETAGHVAFAAV